MILGQETWTKMYYNYRWLRHMKKQSILTWLTLIDKLVNEFKNRRHLVKLLAIVSKQKNLQQRRMIQKITFIPKTTNKTLKKRKNHRKRKPLERCNS